MNKDYDLKKDPHYQTDHLRERITEAIKQVRDETEEVKDSQLKALPNEDQRQSSKNHAKHYSNKFSK